MSSVIFNILHAFFFSKNVNSKSYHSIFENNIFLIKVSYIFSPMKNIFMIFLPYPTSNHIYEQFHKYVRIFSLKILQNSDLAKVNKISNLLKSLNKIPNHIFIEKNMLILNLYNVTLALELFRIFYIKSKCIYTGCL